MHFRAKFWGEKLSHLCREERKYEYCKCLWQIVKRRDFVNLPFKLEGQTRGWYLWWTRLHLREDAETWQWKHPECTAQPRYERFVSQTCAKFVIHLRNAQSSRCFQKSSSYPSWGQKLSMLIRILAVSRPLVPTLACTVIRKQKQPRAFKLPLLQDYTGGLAQRHTTNLSKCAVYCSFVRSCTASFDLLNSQDAFCGVGKLKWWVGKPEWCGSDCVCCRHRGCTSSPSISAANNGICTEDMKLCSFRLHLPWIVGRMLWERMKSVRGMLLWHVPNKPSNVCNRRKQRRRQNRIIW